MTPDLRRFTMARVGLGRAGNSVSTRDQLDFQLAHARARDAVHQPFDPHAIKVEGLEFLVVKSAARDRQEYLRRPDLGRTLDQPSKERVEKIAGPFDVVFVVADGLSPLAVQTQAAQLLQTVTAKLAGWTIAPIVVASQARVALSDEIGALTNSSLAVMLIGERPGLSSADSMGVYLTWAPGPGRTDADRNCISNIRPEGLSVGAASELLLLLMVEARGRRLSGVNLKPQSAALPSPTPSISPAAS